MGIIGRMVRDRPNYRACHNFYRDNSIKRGVQGLEYNAHPPTAYELLQEELVEHFAL